jgi:catechol 2,3-dioxygenase-like lactoylglutathione lyase family enzyme
VSRALHHVALGARDVARVARFYAEAFGLDELARHDDDAGELRSIWLDMSGAVLMVERTSARAARVEGVGPGPFLLAFSIAAHERDALEARLGALGSPVESRTTHTSYFRDPEGHRVAVSDYPVG